MQIRNIDTLIRLMASLALGVLTSIDVQAQTYPSRSAALIAPFSLPI
jgi:hypothetical protein